jgi:superfamily II DNA or RNA helicase
MVDKDHKQWNKDIVVSTWQSLKNNTKELRRYNTVAVDEVHSVRGDILHDILQQTQAFWRFGFTGTMPQDPLESLQVRSYLGPVLKTYKSSKLAEEGYIATCNVVRVNTSYHEDFKGDYNDVKNNVFITPFRLNIISSIVRDVNGSILLLVDKIEKEGDILEKHIKENFPDKQVVFLHGSIDDTIRSYWQKKCHEENNIVIIATFGIFQLGINIKSLRYGVLCSSFKSSIRILQSIGRSLRKHPTKEEHGAFIFDINDKVKFLEKHGDERAKFYGIEEFNVIDVDVNESDTFIGFKQLLENT